MTNMLDKKMLALTAIILVVIIGLVASYSGGSKPTETTSGENETSMPKETDTGTTPTPSTQKPATSGGTQTKPPSQQSTGIRFVSPVSGDKWVFDQNHDITWNKASGRTGTISLLDAQTKGVSGWAPIALGMHHTSYTWDTKTVALGRTNPAKKEVARGTYIFRIAFDGPVAGADSAPFTVIYPSDAQVPVKTITTQGTVFSPSTLTLTKGDKLTFTNKDSITYKIWISNFSVTVAGGTSVTFDTSVLTLGSHTLFSDTYGSLRGTLTVQ